jgi:hypothetical protein
VRRSDARDVGGVRGQPAGVRDAAVGPRGVQATSAKPATAAAAAGLTTDMMLDDILEFPGPSGPTDRLG